MTSRSRGPMYSKTLWTIETLHFWSTAIRRATVLIMYSICQFLTAFHNPVISENHKTSSFFPPHVITWHTCPYFSEKTLFWISPWATPLPLLYQLSLVWFSWDKWLFLADGIGMGNGEEMLKCKNVKKSQFFFLS